jgi:hypothetical protein
MAGIAVLIGALPAVTKTALIATTRATARICVRWMPAGRRDANHYRDFAANNPSIRNE